MICQTLHTPPITLEELCRLDTFLIVMDLVKYNKPSLYSLLKNTKKVYYIAVKYMLSF